MCSISDERNSSTAFQNKVIKCKFVKFVTDINRESVCDNVKKGLPLCCGQSHSG